jgi:hypothetical protein
MEGKTYADTSGVHDDEVASSEHHVADESEGSVAPAWLGYMPVMPASASTAIRILWEFRTTTSVVVMEVASIWGGRSGRR